MFLLKKLLNSWIHETLSKTITFTKRLPKMREREFPQFPHCVMSISFSIDFTKKSYVLLNNFPVTWFDEKYLSGCVFLVFSTLCIKKLCWFHVISLLFKMVKVIFPKNTYFGRFFGNIGTIRNTRTIRVFDGQVFYIRGRTIPTRIGNPSEKSAK